MNQSDNKSSAKNTRQTCGRRWYDFDRSAFIIAYGVIATISAAFGFMLGLLF
mgnify:CR=1 FL=1